jgi:CheY-like chemotaxis protein
MPPASAVAFDVTEPAPVPPPPLKRVKRVVLVDDSTLYAESWRAIFACRYGERVSFEAYQDPIEALPVLGPDIDLLLLDLEMPGLDGKKVAKIAVERGVPKKRIVVVSAVDAEELHRQFPPDSCLAVINKSEAQQQSAFLMILDSLMLRH